MPAKNKKHDHTHILLLRSGLAIVFLYAAVSSLKSPLEWAGYIPHFMTTEFSAVTLVKLFAVFDLLLAIWLISGMYLKVAGAVCGTVLAFIVITNPHDLIVTFRDIGLAFMAFSLIFIDS